MQVVNRTPYVVERAIHMDKNAAEILVVAVKGTWTIGDRTEPTLAETQAPLVLADEYLGDPGKSSVLQECELGLPKPSTNVALLGHARAPRRGIRQMTVSLRAGTIQKSVGVTGRRRWWSLFGFARRTRPEPFEKIPIHWELAYGGTDEKAKAWEPRNPVGRGFRAKKSKLKWKDTELPCLEHPKRPLKKPGGKSIPCGFGFVAPWWEPRVSRAGTYDDRWTEERAPLLPEDFQDTFHHSVPDDQVAPRRFRGGEPIEVVGAGRGERMTGSVPREFPVAQVLFDRSREGLALPLDTVVIDADQGQLRMIWKGALPVHRRSLKVREIEVAIAASRGNGG